MCVYRVFVEGVYKLYNHFVMRRCDSYHSDVKIYKELILNIKEITRTLSVVKLVKHQYHLIYYYTKN